MGFLHQQYLESKYFLSRNQHYIRKKPTFKRMGRRKLNNEKSQIPARNIYIERGRQTDFKKM